MDKCKNCKKWTLNTEDFSAGFEPDPCVPKGYKVCYQDNWHCVNGCTSGIAYSVDAEDYGDVLYTGPEFGCINFQERANDN